VCLLKLVLFAALIIAPLNATVFCLTVISGQTEGARANKI